MSIRAGVWVAVVCLLTTGMANAVVMETVPVGNINNAADSTGYGSVGYTYNIGKYEVTAGQYTRVPQQGGRGGYVRAVQHVHVVGHLRLQDRAVCRERHDASPYQYRVAADYANRPVNYVSFWDACRFANWLHNGQPSGAQDNSTTEDGAYTLTAQGMQPATPSAAMATGSGRSRARMSGTRRHTTIRTRPAGRGTGSTRRAATAFRAVT